MATRARAEKGRFMAGNTELDIIPQKWKQEWVFHQSSKDGKSNNNIGFKTLCWVPVKDIETSESIKTSEVEDVPNLAGTMSSEENKEQKSVMEN
ncbi:hypothetical protein PNEG_00857 [Pneumocystis murina B123]|uniref:Uncharacterized protein n=1 Tax=Pneumocystis murina (strain B123) TaxID=1069680 RepID=M7NTW2_PNEMU|nr:hypothetical protein PNEG_00857 [Pneumocystis murina B123]EMR10707.1 hypothetical protein PNEG_00857 [Pneumocystis murina B123]